MDVAILILMNLNKVKFLNTLGKTALDSVDLIKSSKPFSNEVIIFLDILSKEISYFTINETTYFYRQSK